MLYTDLRAVPVDDSMAPPAVNLVGCGWEGVGIVKVVNHLDETGSKHFVPVPGVCDDDDHVAMIP